MSDDRPQGPDDPTADPESVDPESANPESASPESANPESVDPEPSGEPTRRRGGAAAAMAAARGPSDDQQPEPADNDPADSEPTESVAAIGDDGDGEENADEPPGLVPPVAPSTDDSSGGSRHWGRWVLLGAVSVVAALYVAGYFLTGARLPADVTVGGVNVGGASPASARATLQDEPRPRADEPVVLEHEDQTFEINGADAGLSLDPVASVRQAGGRHSWDPRDMVALFWGSPDYDLVFDVNDEAMDSAVASLTEAVDVPVTEAAITFPDAQPEAQQPEDGLVVRRADAADLIESSYLVADEPVEVPTEVAKPIIGEEGLQQAMTEIAEPAVAGPVTVRVGEESVDLPVTAYAPALTVEPVDGAMTPVIDPEALAEPLTDATTGIGEQAVDATVRIENDQPVVVPGKEGVGLQPQEMAEKLPPVLTESGDARAVEIEADVVEPEFTTEDAEALNITEKISEFTTTYPHAEYRNINQGRAAEILNGTLLKPGEEFSFNGTVGERTAANGFTTGSVINRGRFVDELGGGVSQVVTTTYNAAFFAGLEDIEHHPHAFYIDRYPVGREATVYFGSLDLRFRNNLPNGVLIRSFLNPSTPGSQGSITVQMWGTKEFDVEAGASQRRNYREPQTKYDPSPSCQGQSPLVGFDIDIYRTLSKGGQVVKRETDTAVYQAADRIICGAEPDDEDDD